MSISQAIQLGTSQNPETKATVSILMSPFLQNLLDHLSPEELSRYKNFQYPIRQEQFLLGRYCAKLAVAKQLNLPTLSSFSIDSGVFRQPIIRGITENGLMISLSHSENAAIALAFYDRYICGVDIELISSQKGELIRSLLTAKEKNLLLHLGIKEEESFLLAWCAKESLSKALRTGLCLPFEILEISSIQKKGKEFEIHYSNFCQYTSVNFIYCNHVISITKPKEVSLYGLFAI